MVEYQAKGQRKRVSLGRLPHRQGRACRYRGLFYQGREKEPVDIIVYRERGFKELWFLLVPADSEEILPTESVVRLYRSRMQVEVSFRDFKSWLGVWGLRLKVCQTQRLKRLLTGLAMAYVLLLALGAGPQVQKLRDQIELLRRRARFGSRRTLSLLSLALMLVARPLLLSLSNLTWVFKEPLQLLQSGQPIRRAIAV